MFIYFSHLLKCFFVWWQNRVCPQLKRQRGRRGSAMAWRGDTTEGGSRAVGSALLPRDAFGQLASGAEKSVRNNTNNPSVQVCRLMVSVHLSAD